MLDMGFETEVKGCTDAVKEKLGEQFNKLSVVLAAATTGGKLTDLVQNIMSSYVSVGFETDKDSEVQVPSTIQQLYSFVPTEYRLHYLLAFLFCKRNSKVILFMSTCQGVNYFYELIKAINWQEFAGQEGKKEPIR